MRALERVGFQRFGHAGHGISYNVVVFPSGRAYQGVSFNRRGAHTDGRNSVVRSIAFAGNYTTTAPTAAALETAARIIAEGAGKWVVKGAPIRGHRDIKATACPGNRVYERLSWLKNRSQELTTGSPKPAPKPVPKKPAAKPKPKTKKLDVDGLFGRDTIERFQQELGTPTDRVISSQPIIWKAQNPGLTAGWDWQKNPKGSTAIRRHQEILKARGHYKGKIDGLAGPQYWTAVQADLGTLRDGKISHPSTAVRALQERLNRGRI